MSAPARRLPQGQWGREARCRAALLLALLAAPVWAQQEIADGAPPAAAPDWTARAVPALTAPLAAKTKLLSIARSGERLLAVGQQGVIVASSDGKTWEQRPSPVSQMLTRVRFSDEKTAWATGYDAVILRSGDAGQTWTLQHLDATARPLYDIVFLDAQNGIAVGGYGNYLVTADGGKTWAPQASAIADLGLHINALHRLEDGSLFMAGEKGLLARSTDGGAHWTMLKSPYAGSFFGALPLGGSKVLVYGMRGHVYIAPDLAACVEQVIAEFDPYAVASVEDAEAIRKLGWTRLENPSRESLFAATRLQDGEVFLAGVNGTSLRSELAAGRLQALRTTAAETLTGLVVTPGGLIAVGKRGVQTLSEVR